MLVALGVGVLLFLAVRAVSEPVTVGPGGVEVRTRLLGLCLRTRRLPVDLLESVYVEEGQMFHRLVFAGDGFHLQAGRFTATWRPRWPRAERPWRPCAVDDPLTLKVPNPETGDRNHWQIVALLAFIAVMVVFAAHLAGLGLGVTLVLGGVTWAWCSW